MRIVFAAVAALALSLSAQAESVKVKLVGVAQTDVVTLEKAAKRACKAAPALYGYFSRAEMRDCVAETMTRTLAKIDSPALYAAASTRNLAFAKAPARTTVAASE